MMSLVIDRSLKGNPLAPFLFSSPDIGYKKCAVNPEVVLQSTLQYVGVFTVRRILFTETDLSCATFAKRGGKKPAFKE